MVGCGACGVVTVVCGVMVVWGVVCVVVVVCVLGFIHSYNLIKICLVSFLNLVASSL